MIPLQLTLKNFLSYRDANLDFRGLHTACICGPNGAGKSSLLEAITWVIWGQSRAASEDDIIHAGAKDVRVDFIFQNNQQTHRIIRTRNRGQSSSLEFQVETAGGFRSLTEKGVRATQQLIMHHLKLDYDTFINSAYLRQGRADEFMLRRPNERKQILADLLKLDQYENLAEQAKDLSRQFKGQAEQLEQSLQTIKQQLEQREATLEQQSTLETALQQLQQAQSTDQQQLQQLQAVQHQRSTWQQQLTFVRQQYQNLSKIAIASSKTSPPQKHNSGNSPPYSVKKTKSVPVIPNTSTCNNKKKFSPQNSKLTKKPNNLISNCNSS
jgi:exonuclease SbcC